MFVPKSKRYFIKGNDSIERADCLEIRLAPDYAIRLRAVEEGQSSRLIQNAQLAIHDQYP